MNHSQPPEIIYFIVPLVLTVSLLNIQSNILKRKVVGLFKTLESGFIRQHGSDRDRDAVEE